MKRRVRSGFLVAQTRLHGDKPRGGRAILGLTVLVGLTFSPPARGQEPGSGENGNSTPPPAALSTVPVPLPSDLDQYIADLNMARVLGKALFWDVQAGSDGRTACATCHFHAGTDARTKNTIGATSGQFRGANQTLTANDFPFHRLADSSMRDSAVVFDTSEVVGAQGVIKRTFRQVKKNPTDDGQTVPDPVFNVGGINARQVTRRNAPTVINAVFNDRQFWDGRASRFFNGVNPFGDQDPNARLWKLQNGRAQQVRVLLANASLASQAVGPPNNEVEMSWSGRTFPELGKKMLALKPLGLQKVHPKDSLLGPSAHKNKGLTFKNYSELVRKAFRPEWWNSSTPVEGKFTQMEANFSLFWGLSISLYESLLVSDDSPFDRFARGNPNALTADQKAGLVVFLNQGRCIQCHSGPEFTAASVTNIGGKPVQLVDVETGRAIIDSGFFNIGVRPTGDDLGIGRSDLPFGTVSIARRIQNGEPLLPGFSVSRGARLAVDGAMKVPTLRNVELTGPYMHNGGMSTLTQVVEFYARGADFFDQNIGNLAANVQEIEEVRGFPDRIATVVAFLNSLTDDRVRLQKAPFDHPELVVPNGHSEFKKGVALDNNIAIPAVGADGGPPIRSFEEILDGASL